MTITVMWLLFLCFQCERTRKVRTVFVYHLEMFVHYSYDILSTNHSNHSLVRLFVNSIEVNIAYHKARRMSKILQTYGIKELHLTPVAISFDAGVHSSVIIISL